MIHPKRLKGCIWGVACAATLVVGVMRSPAQTPTVERTNSSIVVKEADTGQPISNAHLTLQFQEPRKIRAGKRLAYSAKTNAQGRYKFMDIPKVTVRLMVTAEHRQSFGKEIEVTENNQVIEVKLKKPQPLL
jgi:hypothetical protein